MPWQPSRGDSSNKLISTWICPECGRPFQTSPARAYARYHAALRRGAPNRADLCDPCTRQHQQATLRANLAEKYGVTNVSLLAAVQAKKEATCLLNQGTRHPMQSPEVQARSRARVRAHYGVDNVMHAPEVVATQAAAVQAATGRTNVFQGPQGLQVAQQGMQARYGARNPMQVPEITARHRAGMQENHGVQNPFQIPDVIKQNALKRSEWARAPAQQDAWRKRWVTKLTEGIPEGWAFDIPEFEGTHVVFRCPSCAAQWRVHQSNPLAMFTPDRDWCPSCRPVSAVEDRVEGLLDRPEIWERRNRGILNPGAMAAVGLSGVVHGLELDYYCPTKRVAIEVNGTYFHSEDVLLRNHPTWTPAEARRFHWYKWKCCAQQGIQLITLWTHEISDRLRPFLRNLTGAETEVIGARELTVDAVVPDNEAATFYDAHHLQGGCNGRQHVGLRGSRGDLRAVMTFAPAQACRSGLGDVLLQRFATHGRVPGAASRLAALAPPGVLLSYSDNRYSTGKLYERLGFELARDSAPDYCYAKGLRWFAKASKQRGALAAEAAAQGLDSSGTEAQLAHQLKYLRVWDCGKKTWRRSR